MDDLSKTGMTMEAVSAAVPIPASTLAGYKSSNVEPKHEDGERLVALWQQRLMPALPMTKWSVRNRGAERGGFIPQSERLCSASLRAAGLARDQAANASATASDRA